ncbi:MAG: FtsQ-type POTRA domain-containing protein [Cellvibrionales bacterium]|nr:FtsQ-type POTRA domain-containing protein [Cellvibrionales bacterium]
MSGQRSVSSRSRRGAKRPLAERLSRLTGAGGWAVLCLLAVGVLYGGGLGVAALDRPIKQVMLEGEFQNLDPEALRAVLLAERGAGILSLDIRALRERLANIAWVGAVAVRREYPATLVVAVTEAQAVAAWNRQGYLSAQGELIASPELPSLAHLPRLHLNPRGAAATDARQALELFHQLNSVVGLVGEQIVALEQSAADGLQLVLRGGLRVNLGRAEHLHLQRVRLVSAAWSRLQPQQRARVAQIDARYANGVAVRFATAAARIQPPAQLISSDSEG